jgi:hypothetical protein
MTNLTMSEVEQTFADCKDRDELREALSTILAEDQVLKDALERKKAIQRLKGTRAKEIEKAELAPYEDEARRWKHGQKVYFGRDCQIDHFGFDLKFRRGARVKKGEWCRVYQYQPRAKRLWLCQPGKSADRRNVMNHDFGLRDIKDYQISRTELELRQS